MGGRAALHCVGGAHARGSGAYINGVCLRRATCCGWAEDGWTWLRRWSAATGGGWARVAIRTEPHDTTALGMISAQASVYLVTRNV